MVMVPAETILMAEQEAKDRAAAFRSEREDLRGALWKVLYWASEAPLDETKERLGRIAADALGEPFPV